MSLLGFEREGSSSDGVSQTGSTFPTRPQTTISGRVPSPRWASPWWLLFLGLAIAEVVALGVREQRVPRERDWTQAAEYVRRELGPQDAVTVAPGWADPLLRLYLGDKIDAKMAGRSSLDGYERLFVISLRGARAPESPRRDPDGEEVFGRLRVERYDLGRSPVLVDLADAWSSARVEMRQNGVDTLCPLRTFPPTMARGGLGGGIIAPTQRFQCDFDRPWLWVAPTVIEALDLSPRHCIWTHPQGVEPMSITYGNVTLGTRLVLYGGLDYHDERDGDKAPVELRAFVNGQEVGQFVHRDGDGMARWEVDLSRALGKQLPVRGDLRLQITTPEPFRRSFCWTGTLQHGARREP
jgi:hypothetical protein